MKTATVKDTKGSVQTVGNMNIVKDAKGKIARVTKDAAWAKQLAKMNLSLI
jgi:hypothetical protein